MKYTAVALAAAIGIATVGFSGVQKAEAAPWVAPAIVGAAVGTTIATGTPFGLGYGPYAYSPHAYAPGYGAYAYSPMYPDAYAPSQPTSVIPHGFAYQPNMEHDAYAASSS